MRSWMYIAFALSFFTTQFVNIRIAGQNFSMYRVYSFITIILSFLIVIPKFKFITKYTQRKTSRILNFYLFWLVYAIFSVLWVKSTFYWIRAIIFVGSGISSILLINTYCYKKKDFIRFIRIALLIFAMLCIIGYYEIITGNYYFINQESISSFYRLRAPVAWMGNLNDFAPIMIFSVFIFYISYANSKNMLWRSLSMIFMGLCSYLCIQSGSRGSILGLFVGILTFILVYVQRGYLKYLAIAMIAIIFLSLLFPSISNYILDSIPNIQINLKDPESGTTDDIRMTLIRNGLIFLRDTHGFGVGAGNIEYWMGNFQIIGHKIGYGNIHNWWFELLVGYGVIIFIGYILCFVEMMKTFYSAAKSSNDVLIKNVSLGMLCCMSSFIIASTSSSSLIGDEWLWVFFGIIIMAHNLVETEYKQNRVDIRAIS